MEENELKQALKRLEEQQKQISEDISKLQNTQQANQIYPFRRDFWDKLGAISPILSGLLIASGAFMCTYSYNQQQVKLQEAQTIEKFIPHLMGNETSKRMAILCLKSLVNTDLAAKYAAMFPSEGTLSALKQIAKTGDSQDQKIVYLALEKTKNEMSEQQRTVDEATDADQAAKNDTQASRHQNDGDKDAVQETSHKPAADSGAPIPGTGATKDSAKADASVQTETAGKGRVPAKERTIFSDERSLLDSQLPKSEVELRHNQPVAKPSLAKDEMGSDL